MTKTNLVAKGNQHENKYDGFKAFAVRGNVVDLAVGVIIGAAFGKIVSPLVNDIIMPPIGLALGRVDFKNLWPFTSLQAQEAYAAMPDGKDLPFCCATGLL